MRKKKLFGEIMIEKKFITADQLKTALQIQKEEGGTLGQTLVRLGYVDEEKISECLSEYYGVPYLKLTDYEIDPAVLELIPEEIVRKYQILPMDRIGNTLTIATADFNNVVLMDELKILSGFEIVPLATSEKDIAGAIEKYYKKVTLEDTIKDISEEEQDIEVAREEEEVIKTSDLQVQTEEAPVVKLVNFIIMQAIEDGASDIHIEPYEEELRLRYRIDGVLYEAKPSPPRKMQRAIVSRLKILSNLDIAEQRTPQDGRVRVKTKSKIVDLRVSVLPTVFGEKVVMRLLDKSSLTLDFRTLGVDPDDIEKFEECIERPYGMILVTGPTSCGKTTTLYSVLTRLNSCRDNLITVEDPVEYQIKGINQMQVRPEIGLTFEIGLRAILRQDPDIIMIGEIRDLESIEIAIKSALTGHLVLSTIHTNNACGTIARLINMGAEPFLLTASLLLVISQRLIRTVCPQCKEVYRPPFELLQRAGISPEEAKEISFFRGRGCDHCRNTGYKGRIAIMEVLTLNRHIKELILEGATPGVLEEAAKKELKFRTMGEVALGKAKKGITSLEEALSLTVGEETG